MEDSTLQKTLQEIYTARAFGELEQFQNESLWPQMKPEEREMLALLFVMKGESLLKEQKEESQKAFQTACEISPDNPKILCRQALSYLCESHDLQFLKSACEAATRSITLNPHFFDGWYVWGNALMTLGVNTQEIDYFYEADRKFAEAHKVRAIGGSGEKLFWWRWGLCWHFIAKQSGEATDFRSAIEKYQYAVEDGLAGTPFWNDYGNALVDFACLITKHDLFVEAIELYLKAVKETPDFFEGWFNVACCYQKLFEVTEQDTSFQSSHLTFERAAELNEQDATLWYRWGQLLSYTGKLKRRLDLVESSLEKFEKAHQLFSEHPSILRDWADALILVGGQRGELELLREAEKKVLKSLEIQPENSCCWSIYGACLNELGRYFADEEYYSSAIEKFQYGISLNRTDPMLWYGLALSHFALGDLQQDSAVIEKAARYCSRAIEFGGDMFPQFWNDWGVALLRLGELTHKRHYIEASVEKFEQAIRRYQGEHHLTSIDPRWLYNYGCALDYMGDFHDDEAYYEKAVQALSQVLVLDPDFFPVHFNLGLAYCHLAEVVADVEHFYKACEQFQLVVTQDPEDEMAWNEWGVTLLHLAQLLHEPSRPDAVSNCYQQAESKLFQAASLGSVQAFYNLACLYSLTGNQEACLHYLERAQLAEALPLLDDLLHDDWLESIRETPEFRAFLEELTKPDSDSIESDLE